MEVVCQLELHRRALTGHCYRILGSAVDADDAVQETMIRAWRGFNSFDSAARFAAGYIASPLTFAWMSWRHIGRDACFRSRNRLLVQ